MRVQKKQKNHNITEPVAEKLGQETHGQQSLIVENLLRVYYEMDPYHLDEMEEQAYQRLVRNVLQ